MKRSFSTIQIAAATLLCCFLNSTPVSAAVYTNTWLGTSSDKWSDADKWSLGVDPNNTATDIYHIFTVADSFQSLPLYNGMSRTVQSVHIATGAYLSTLYGSALTVVDGLTNDGTLSQSGNSTINITGPMINNGTVNFRETYNSGTFNGTGTGAILSGTGYWNLSQSYNFSGKVTFGPDFKLRTTNAGGYTPRPLSLSLSGTFTNKAEISLDNAVLADTDSMHISISGSMRNENKIEVLNGGTMYLHGTIDNRGGTLTIGEGGKADLTSSLRIIGGQIEGGGNIYTYGRTTGASTFQDTTIGSNVNIYISNQRSMKVRNSVTNNGTIYMSAVHWNNLVCGYYSGGTYVTTYYPATIEGSGSILFNSTQPDSGVNQINGYGLILGADQTIAVTASNFQGRIRTDLINYGTIDAREGRISMTEDLVNHGTLKTGVGGQLDLPWSYGTFDNENGTIFADFDSSISLSGPSRIEGGSIGGRGLIYLNSTAVELPGRIYMGEEDTGTFTARGRLIFTNSTLLSIKLGGTSPNAFDKLDAVNGLQLNGTLDVQFMSGYQPFGGESFDILDWPDDEFSGTFSSTNLPALANGLSWNLSDLYVDGTIAIVEPPDTDDDGLPDFWENQYKLDTGSDDSDADVDQDGVPNLHEYIADTNPTNKNSMLAIQLAATNWPFSYEFTSSGQRLYTLLRCTNLVDGTWEPVETPRPGTGGTDSLTDTNLFDCSMYKIQVQLP